MAANSHPHPVPPPPTDPVEAEAALWRAEIEARLSGHARFRALGNLELWAGVARAVRALAPASDITSYSIAGRSYTKADFDVLRSREQQLRADIEADIEGIGDGVRVVVGEVLAR